MNQKGGGETGEDGLERDRELSESYVECGLCFGELG
jgi:hypothetical protein